MRPVAIVQARMGSSRLPGKVLKPLVGKPMLAHIVARLRSAPELAEVVVATSDQPGDAPIRELCAREGIACFAGSENDVLDRFYRAAVEHRADPVLRVTADCPFVDPGIVGRIVALYAQGGNDYVSVATGAGALHMKGGRFPDGMDLECFSFATLERTFREAVDASDREHVTPYIYRVEGRFRRAVLTDDQDRFHVRLTVDHEADFQLVTRVYEALHREDRVFGLREILDYLDKHPELSDINRELGEKQQYSKVWDPSSR